MSFRITVITNPMSVMAADSPGHSFTCWSSGTSFPEGLFSKGVECMCTDWSHGSYTVLISAGSGMTPVISGTCDLCLLIVSLATGFSI